MAGGDFGPLLSSLSIGTVQVAEVTRSDAPAGRLASGPALGPVDKTTDAVDVVASVDPVAEVAPPPEVKVVEAVPDPAPAFPEDAIAVPVTVVAPPPVIADRPDPLGIAPLTDRIDLAALSTSDGGAPSVARPGRPTLTDLDPARAPVFVIPDADSAPRGMGLPDAPQGARPGDETAMAASSMSDAPVGGTAPERLVMTGRPADHGFRAPAEVVQPRAVLQLAGLVSTVPADGEVALPGGDGAVAAARPARPEAPDADLSAEPVARSGPAPVRVDAGPKRLASLPKAAADATVLPAAFATSRAVARIGSQPMSRPDLDPDTDTTYDCATCAFLGTADATPSVTLVLASGVDARRVDDLVAQLRGQGFGVIADRQASLPIARGQVRYYREIDAPSARAIARETGSELVDVTWFDPPPADGLIEIFVTAQGQQG